jgi:glycosyltransferase involved in cell wall biosynthesis
MADRPRVLQIITRMNVGGATRHVIKLHEHLLATGFDSTIVWGKEGPREGVITPTGAAGTDHVHVPTLRREIRPWNDARAYAAISHVIAERRPHIVHTHMAKAGALGRIAASRANVPVVVHTYHGHVLEGYFSGPVSRGYVAAERALAKRSTTLVAVSPQIRDELMALSIGRPEQWIALPLSLDLDALLSSSLDRAGARARLGLPRQALLVGIVGRLAPIKRVDLFLDAASRVARDVGAVEFVIAGDGPERDRLQQQGRELLGPRAHFLGWVSDLEALYASLDIAVLTSRNEGTPVALIEAAAMRVPAVATNVGGVPDVVHDGRTGMLVHSDESGADPAAIATAIARLAGDREFRLRMGEEARSVIAQRYGTTEAVDPVVALYRTLLARSISGG